jgi:twitching motility protein PilT
MILERLVTQAREAGASDLHLEGGLPPARRVRGELKMGGEPVPPAQLAEAARQLLGEEGWEAFTRQHSADVARTIAGVRCRINVLQSARGVGLAVRLLAPFQSTLRSLNLHPSLRRLIERRHGLVIVSGPTGSGKSSTLAALVQEVNLAEARHIVTIESPVEHVITPRQSLIRQREVGRHTPSVAQALIDAMREDPDVLMVGEMRDPETMRLTLNAAETGHLVLTTLHSSSCAEALQRIVSAFPAEEQPSVASQLADCLVAVVCQRLVYRPELRLLVPECEILMATSGAKGVIRQGHMFKLTHTLESGGQDGCFTFARYRDWLDARTDWAQPTERESLPPDSLPTAVEAPLPRLPSRTVPAPRQAPRADPPRADPPRAERAPLPPSPDEPADAGVIVIDEAEDPAEVLAHLHRRPKSERKH